MKCDSEHSDDMFRRIDGVCNNVALHTQRHWGAAGTPFNRLAGYAYADGLSHPRSAPGLPTAREVSEAMHAAEVSGTASPGPLTTKGLTLMIMQFGQFLDHDITFTPQAGLASHICANPLPLLQLPGEPPVCSWNIPRMKVLSRS